MTARSEAFTASKTAYLNYIEDPRGRLFYQMLQEQLESHLPSLSSRVLDIGCGLGMSTEWLARKGHRVTGVDLTEDYLEVAKQRAADSGISAEYRLLNLDEEDLTSLGEPFDWVLCHNVLEYVRSADEALAKIAASTASGGHLSLVAHNPDAKVLQAAIYECDPVLALRKFGQSTAFINMVQDVCHIFTPAELTEKLRTVGFDVVAHYGIRTVYDLMKTDRRAEPEYYEQIHELERKLCTHSPFRDIAIFTHLIARKR